MSSVSFFLPPLPVVVREVWQYNLEDEFDLIKIAAMTHHMVSMDTEFPGVVYRPANVDNRCLGKLPPVLNYQIMRDNVNATNIIQLGLALCDDNGNLPNFGTMAQYVWQFNFSDFDVYTDLQNTDSIDLLKRQGIDFDRNLQEGIDTADFAAMMVESGLLFNPNGSDFAWVTFHGGYDFAHLMKIMNSNKQLPNDLPQFMCLVFIIFGRKVFDLKNMMKFCDGLYGGLENVANKLGVQRVAGKSHQAGSDSLLTMQTFRKFLDIYFKQKSESGLRHNGHLLSRFQCVLHGLEPNNYFDQFNGSLKPFGNELSA
jgi:CCR4-NOT transcription complex subunit 7/8|uniref:poly(A)-specific ribonuclease n=1 Tax=Fagus sylvatica TaxID=28930 RepID=A0A2N9H8J9_FAGSY